MAKASRKLNCVSAICAGLLVLLFFGCAPPRASDKDLRLDITSPANNAELSTNLANVTGTVSVSDAAVTVQGHAAYVDAQGNFTGYALLSEGDNTFEVAASANGQTRTQTMNLSFTPPLAVFLDGPDYGVDHTQTPLIATGTVSDPRAVVTVNGLLATVSADGSFSVPVRVSIGDTLTEVATLGDKTDNMTYFISQYPPPGPISIFNQEYAPLIYINEGGTFAQQMPGVMPKIIRRPSELNYQLKPIALVNGRQQPAPWPEGLELRILPPSFKVYPKASYSPLMVVKAASGMPSGEYYFEIDTTIVNSSFTGGTIKVVVLPQGGSIVKTIEVNQSQTTEGITFTLQRVQLTATGIKITAFNTPPDYALPQGPELAPPQFMALHARASYSIDNNWNNSAGSSGIQFIESGMLHTWNIDLPVPKGSKTLTFTISELGNWYGPWQFQVPLD